MNTQLSEPLEEEAGHLETLLMNACRVGDHTTLSQLLEGVNEDLVITYAVQQRQHIVLEDVVKYIMVLLSHPFSCNEIDLEACEGFLGLISRYCSTPTM